MAQGMRGKLYFLSLIGIAAGISTWMALTIILTRFVFANNVALPVATAGAIAVFGAILYRVYKMYRPKTEDSPPAQEFELEFPESHIESQVSNVESPGSILESKIERCLILAAPTHGVLQDRLNYWLSGNYGTIKSTALTSTDKGFFLSIIYEEKRIHELTQKQAELTDERGIKQ